MPPLPRLVASADFERVLGVRSRAATAHFAVHHLLALAAERPQPATVPRSGKLSTVGGPESALPVEDSLPIGPVAGQSWVGAVVPKRHARRAVTRSLIKRQIYRAAERHRDQLAPGLWIVRLRSPFDRADFPSAASPALARSARAELDALLATAVGWSTS